MRRWLVPLLLQVANLTVALAAGGQVSLFSELPTGDEIRLVCKTQGCFGGETFELLFKHGTNFSATLWYLSGPAEATKVFAGSVSLSDADLRGLDKLLWFYRSNPGGGCTTVDRINISHMRNKEILATEQFTDGSCIDVFPQPGVEGVLCLSTVISKMEPPPTHWRNSDSLYVALGTIGVSILAASLIWFAIFTLNVLQSEPKKKDDPNGL